MCDVRHNGDGRDVNRWSGVLVETLISDSEVEIESEENDRKRGRAPSEAAAAPFVIEIVDIVVCESPERVISMWLCEPNKSE